MTMQPRVSYRLRLERETDNTTICAWSKIPEERIRPLLHTLRAVIPWMEHAGRARRALRELLDAIS
jgi:hypothetical protein